LTSQEILLHRLEIKAAQPCWVQVRTDNKKTENVLLHPGENRAWVADQEVEVVLGNAGGVEMQWDYKPVTLGGRPGQVLRLKLPQ
jgi:cytoskeleton protein RodZ